MSVHVTVDNRKFIVDFADDGSPARIKERKHFTHGPITGVFNAPYWHAKHHKLGGPKTLSARIVEAARAKL